MVAAKNILFFITAVSALAINRRDVSTVTADITLLDTDTQALITAIAGYTGGILSAIPIQTAESQLETDLTTATTNAQAQTQFSSADSTTVINQINSQLAPDVQTALANLVAKKAQVVTDGILSLVQSDLTNLKAKTDTYGAALAAIASADTVTAAQAALATIDSYFAAAITSFAS